MKNLLGNKSKDVEGAFNIKRKQIFSFISKRAVKSSVSNLIEEELKFKNKMLNDLSTISIELANLTSDVNLEIYIPQLLKRFTSAKAVSYSEYDIERKALITKHVELESAIFNKVLRLLPNNSFRVVTPVSEEKYNEITQQILTEYKTVAEITFNEVSARNSDIISTLLGANRYIALSLMIDNVLFGSVVLALDERSSFLPNDILKNLSSLITLTLRRKKLEEDLFLSKEKYKVITQSTLDVIFIVNKFGKQIFFNDKLESMLGYRNEDVIGKYFTDFIPKLQISLYLRALKQVFSNKELKNFRTQIYHKDGHLVDVEINGALTRFNDELVGLGTIRDLTERVQSEQALQRSEERLAMILSSLPVSIYLSPAGEDIDVELMKGNVVGITGYTEQDFLSEIDFWRKNIHPEDKERVINAFKDCKKNGDEVIIEYRWKSKNGEYKWILDHGVLKIQQGEKKFLGIFLDINDKKNYEELVNSKNSELKELNLEKDKLFSILAHDLKGPINSFTQLSEIMLNESALDLTNKTNKVASILHKSATNVNALLESLLEWSSIQRNLKPFTMNRISISTLINSCIEQHLEIINRKKLLFEINVDENIYVFSDTVLIESVLRNILTNAVKFSWEGGCIQVNASVNNLTNIVQISIKDSGVGMSKTLQDNLFKLNTNVKRVGTHGEQSNGLGLIICKDLVAKIGQKLWVESEENVGTTFHFTLPICDEMEDN